MKRKEFVKKILVKGLDTHPNHAPGWGCTESKLSGGYGGCLAAAGYVSDKKNYGLLIYALVFGTMLFTGLNMYRV